MPRIDGALINGLARELSSAIYQGINEWKEPLRQGLNEEVLVTQLFTLLASYTMVHPTGHAKKQVPLEQVIDLFLYGAIKR